MIIAQQINSSRSITIPAGIAVLKGHVIGGNSEAAVDLYTSGINNRAYGISQVDLPANQPVQYSTYKTVTQNRDLYLAVTGQIAIRANTSRLANLAVGSTFGVLNGEAVDAGFGGSTPFGTTYGGSNATCRIERIVKISATEAYIITDIT